MSGRQQEEYLIDALVDRAGGATAERLRGRPHEMLRRIHLDQK